MRDMDMKIFLKINKHHRTATTLFAISALNTMHVSQRFWEPSRKPQILVGQRRGHEDLPGHGGDHPEWLRHRLLPEAPVGCVQGLGSNSQGGSKMIKGHTVPKSGEIDEQK